MNKQPLADTGKRSDASSFDFPQLTHSPQPFSAQGHPRTAVASPACKSNRLLLNLVTETSLENQHEKYFAHLLHPRHCSGPLCSGARRHHSLKGRKRNSRPGSWFQDQQFTVLIGAGAQGRRSRTLIYVEDVESIEFDSATTAASSVLANDDSTSTNSTSGQVSQPPRSNPPTDTSRTPARTDTSQSSAPGSPTFLLLKLPSGPTTRITVGPIAV